MPSLIYQKENFFIPSQTHYVAGHSLGPLSFQAKHQSINMLKMWERHGVVAWDKGLIDLPTLVANKIARLVWR